MELNKLDNDSALDNGSTKQSEKVLSVLGSGDYGRALSSRLVKSGYTVYISSRNPEKNTIQNLIKPTGATLVDQEEALSRSNIIILAVGREHYDNLPLSSLSGKIIIDVSNNTKIRKGPHHKSNAEYLQALIPESVVVKAFNVISAYSLENGGLQGSKEIYISGNNSNAKQIVADIIRASGFTPVDWGTLQAARDIENVPLQLMPSWRSPLKVCLGIFVVQYIIFFIGRHICANIATGRWNETWEGLAQVTFHRVLAISSLWILAFCYLPGIIAAYIQLWRGTKYSRFPQWLDNWLKMRKQLGLIMLGMVSIHAFIAMGYMNPKMSRLVYGAPKTVKAMIVAANGSLIEEDIQIYDPMLSWNGQIFLSLAAIAYFLTVILGITSLPSVTATLSWREFSFIQTKLGWAALIFGTLHDIFYGWDYAFETYLCGGYKPIGAQIALYAPFLCFILKLPLLIPMVDKKLKIIRQGHDRNPKNEKNTV